MQENTLQSRIIVDDEITLKDIIAKIIEYTRLVLRKWYIVGLCGALGVGYFLYEAFTKKPEYKAKLTFMLNDNSGGNFGLSAVLGGIDISGGDVGWGTNKKLEKIIALSKSMFILKEALFKKSVIKETEDFYANHIIRDLGFHKGWRKDTTGLKDFYFKHNDFEKFTRTENKALQQVIAVFVPEKGNPLFSSSYDKKSEIMTLGLNTGSEELSINLLKTIFYELSSFYVDKSTAKENKTFEVIKQQADSIKRLAVNREMGAAQMADQRRGVFSNLYNYPVERAKKEAIVYNTMYAESQKNLAIAKFALENKIPYVQEIDMPMAPIKPATKSKKMAVLIGGALGFFLSLMWIIGGNILGNAIREARVKT
jgi:hypothetical protein